ncbi:MAG: sensor histidine kinase [Chitinophagales bacterium]|nr:sensor histidine kinase [Chitinophagales bacterium]
MHILVNPLNFDIVFNVVFLTIFVYHVFYFMVQYVVIRRAELFYYSLFLLSAATYYFVFDSSKVFKVSFQPTLTSWFAPIEQSFAFIQTFFYLSFMRSYLSVSPATPRPYQLIKYYRYYNLIFLLAFPVLYFAGIKTPVLYAIVSLLTMPLTILTVVVLFQIRTIYSTVLLIGTSCTVLGMLLSFPVLIYPTILPVNAFVPAQIGLMLDLFILGYGLSLKAADSDKKLVIALLDNQQLLEEERTRFARDLHDGLGGLLSSIKLLFNGLKENLSLSNPLAQQFDQSLAKLDTGITELRKIAHNMKPENLQQLGLNAALKDFCITIQQGTGCIIQYEHWGMENYPINNPADITIYRITQELVNNALKHAHSKLIIVQLKNNKNCLTLTVEDKGKGFDTRNINSETGSGIKSIYSRINLLKGSLHIDSTTRGTLIKIEIPIAM